MQAIRAVFLCFQLFICIHVFAGEKDSAKACRGRKTFSCGDNLCMCCNTADKKDIGTCSNETWNYIPRMPDSVRYLSIGGGGSRINVSTITLTDQFFSNVTQVTQLTLASMTLQYIGRDVFSRLKNLGSLAMSGISGLTMDSVRNMLSIPGLHTFIGYFCLLPVPAAQAFRNMKSDVQSLVLSAEKADYVYDMTSFCSLQQLRYIEIMRGKMIKVETTCILHIETLILTDNNIDSLPTTCTNQSKSFYPHLKTLNLARNNIRSVVEACLPELTSLLLNENKFRYFSDKGLQITQFPILKYLYLKGVVSAIWGIYSYAFSHPTLERLVFDKSNIDFGDRGKVLSYAFAGCPRLTELSMLYNTFEYVDDGRFFELFGNLNLSVLRLSHNDLSSISWRAFDHFHNLQRLELVDTGVTDLPDRAFSSLAQLHWLDIRDNKIATVTEKTFSGKMRHQLQFLGLDENPFTCSCDLMWFRNWFVSQPTLFVEKPRLHLEYSWLNPTQAPKYKCNNLPGTHLTDFMMADQACVLSQSVNVAIILVTSAIIVTLTTVSLVFRFRWHIRLALYEVFRGRGDVRRLRLLADCFDYDVFVSYTSDDLPWVQEHLMPELEGRLGLRLCVHERDFIPGNNIVDNIVECVQSSKKILMVFSKDFVHSQWCQFELTFCLTHVMDYDDTLLIVCVDDVMSRDMTPAMMAVLKTTTYIQWGDHGDAVDSFWRRLRLALHEVTDMAVVVNRDVVVDRARAHDRDVVVEIAEVVHRHVAVDRNMVDDRAESTV